MTTYIILNLMILNIRIKRLFAGVKVEIARGVLFNAFEKAVIEKAERMMGATLSRAKTSPSPWYFLINLWEKYAVPGILYGTESTPLSVATVNKLESVQRELIVRGLGLAQGTPTCFTLLLSGLKPFWFRTFKNAVNFYKKVSGPDLEYRKPKYS